MIRTLLHINDTLVTKLGGAAKALEAEEVLPPDDERKLQTIYKQISMVGDFERQLVKQGYLSAAGTGEALDLDAARAEIARRLARLRAAADIRGAT